jgi:hypothetical protein
MVSTGCYRFSIGDERENTRRYYGSDAMKEACLGNEVEEAIVPCLGG